MIQNIDPQQKWRIYRAILEHLIQDEMFDYKNLFQTVLYDKNKDKGFFFIIPTNFRLLLVDQRNYKFYDLDPPILYIDIPQNTFEKQKQSENKKDQQSEKEKDEPFSIKQNTKSKYKDLTCIVFKKFWTQYIFEMEKKDLPKFQELLKKISEQKRYPRPYQLQKEILQTNKQISDFYLHDFIHKKVKIATQEQFWQLQPSYKIPISYTQETYSKNADFLLNELMNNCKIYKLSSIDKPDYKEKLDLLVDLSYNNVWEENNYMRNRPPKTSKKEQKETSEKTQEAGFKFIYEQQQINRELGKYYIKTFGLKMIDDLIYQKIEQEGTILEPTFLQQIEQENDGLIIETPSSKTKSSQKIAPMIKKQYQTNNEWERDRSAILQTLKSFNVDSRFQKIEVAQTIREDYTLSFKISSHQRKKLEDSQHFLIEVRQTYANVRRLLQYFFQGVQNKINTEQLKEHEQILKDEINIIRNKIRSLPPLEDRDKFKITMYEDLQKQIEKAINEVMNS